MFGRSWVRFLSGTQIFLCPTLVVMSINLPFTNGLVIAGALNNNFNPLLAIFTMLPKWSGSIMLALNSRKFSIGGFSNCPAGMVSASGFALACHLLMILRCPVMCQAHLVLVENLAHIGYTASGLLPCTSLLLNTRNCSCLGFFLV